ncbi:succinate--CoA ligase subunit alpha, partial [Campylobacter coli]|nr:succinate--CoA ligase subunit alpha [Campylobacter coli]
SGTLTYEAANQVVQGGYGISTAVGIGGDPIIGLAYKELLSEFQKDDETKAIVMIGEIGGSLEVEAAKFIKENIEVEAAKFIKENISKPVVAFIAGATAPKGKRMGHAGAIVGSADESAAAKKEALKSYGIHVVDSPALIGEEIQKILG